jgi:ABC-type spermidine/putrescine transport system permease subunit II
LRSAVIAFPAAGIAVVLAAALALGLQRTRLRFEGAFVALCTLPLLVPGVALAIAIYTLYIRFGLLDSYTGMILAHVVHVMPLAILIVIPAIRSIPADLELAAMTLGATRRRAWADVTLRLLMPSLAAAGIVVFLNSFDEATLASFISGPNTESCRRRSSSPC